ncbi:MAG: MBL fold metallo-hydrolase [Candidatus Auribacter fodinae]|jgi:glyoxylase-like metal-dependent hydrolase (beta-lactamase superfamily II)|uniref:MBL fold metallo-hydrolase n=1 Tax=Candidatus Auribacter fodinae TaxID=2093366 RepID=A0A3A4QZW5_9BACT|nr:MAG: MBL fold metallo-hydrolase [Candidatus Auribacter fodinae]
MKIKKIVCGPLETNCYVLWCEDTMEGIIIDPGSDVSDILSFIDKTGITVKHILLTHGHFDHCCGLQALKQRFAVHITIHKDDIIYVAEAKNHALLYGIRVSEIPLPDRFLEDGDTFYFGKYAITAIATPGHTPGGVCFLAGNHLFSGDTLFQGSVGRTDLPGGNHVRLLESITTRLYTLPLNTIVYPGHGSETSIAEEKNFNPFTS